MQRVPATASVKLPSSADAYIQAAALAAEDNAPEVSGGALEESYVERDVGLSDRRLPAVLWPSS